MSTRFRGLPSSYFFFFFNDTATTEIYTLSLHELFRSHSPLAAHRLHVDRWGWRGRGADDPARWRGRLPEPDADRAVQCGPRGAGTLQRRDGARLHRIGGPASDELRLEIGRAHV